jgi:hypothetical protein
VSVLVDHTHGKVPPGCHRQGQNTGLGGSVQEAHEVWLGVPPSVPQGLAQNPHTAQWDAYFGSFLGSLNP